MILPVKRYSVTLKAEGRKATGTSIKEGEKIDVSHWLLGGLKKRGLIDMLEN